MAASKALVDSVTSASADTVVGTVPDGHVWIVKDIRSWSTYNGTQSVSVFAHSGVGGVFVSFITPTNLTRATGVTWQGWVVLPAGSTIEQASTLGICFIHVSGAQLVA